MSQRAPAYWRAAAALRAAVLWVLALAAAGVTAVLPHGWWTWLVDVVAVLAVGATVATLVVMPRIRYRVHRWEVTDIAVHVRRGWLTVVDEIVPLSRVQTVDSTQGPLMRMYGLRTVTVATASSLGVVAIDCLDDAVARQVVARLVTITAATPEDAT